jgi:branched-chain amino acid transport system substrate-binding protein
VRAAQKLGLRVVAHGRADAAYVGGLLGLRTRTVLAAARRRASNGPLVLSAGFGPAAQLATVAAPLAENAYLVVAGVPNEELPEAGSRFAAHFDAQIGRSPHPYAIYAAQAAQVLLDAIAASDGSRRSVAAKVLAAKVEDGLIGSFGFDENGDPTTAAVTIMRIHGGRAEIVRVVDSGVP